MKIQQTMTPEELDAWKEDPMSGFQFARTVSVEKRCEKCGKKLNYTARGRVCLNCIQKARNELLPLTCAVCGIEFFRPRWVVNILESKRGERRCCSPRCVGRARWVLR